MLLKIWLINIVLIVAVFLAGMKSIEVWTERRSLSLSSPRGTSAWTEKRLEKKTLPPETDYEVVVSSNLFFADRSEVREEPSKEGPAPVRQAVGGELQTLELSIKHTNLYGVIMVDDHREALIGSAPVRRPGMFVEDGAKRAKVGDMVGRFKVKEIKSTSALLTAGGYEWTISMFDKDKPKKRDAVKKETGPIVIGAGPVAKTGEASAGGREKGPSSAKEAPTKPVSPPGTGSVREKGLVAAPATPTRAVPQKTGDVQRTIPEPPRINPATIWKGPETKSAPSVPGSDKR